MRYTMKELHDAGLLIPADHPSLNDKPRTQCCGSLGRYDYDMGEFVCGKCGEEKPVMMESPIKQSDMKTTVHDEWGEGNGRGKPEEGEGDE